MAPSVDRGAERREQLLGTLLDDAAFIWIALAQRTHQRLGLFPGDMRRQRRHIGVGDELDDDRAIGCQRQIPGRADVIRLVDADALEAEHLAIARSEEHTSELQSLMRISYAVFCLKKKTKIKHRHNISYVST